MSARRLLLGVLSASCALMGSLVLVCSVASAAVTHRFLSKITEVPAGSGASLTGALGKPWGLTVGNEVLYIADPGNGVVDEFNSTGGFVKQVTGTGAPYGRGVAVNDVSGEMYVAESLHDSVFVFDSAGSFLGEWTGADTPAGSLGLLYVYDAVDNSTSLSDPAAGDVYAVDSYNRVVDVFTPEANGKEKYVTQITGTTSGPFGDPFGVAVDPKTGVVYVVDDASGGRVDAFKPLGLGQYEFLYSISGAPGGSFSGELGGIGVDPTDGDLYVSDTNDNAVDEFSSTGAYLGQMTEGAAGRLREPLGVAVNGGGEVYVAEGSVSTVAVFTANIVAPDVTTTAATNLAPTSVTLSGTVNPNNTSVTACWFEYVKFEETTVHTVPCSQSLPLTGNAPVHVSGQATGLEIGAGYRYRLAVSDSDGTFDGSFVSFETLITRPGIESESVESIGLTVATLRAMINQHKSASTYHFEYGSTESYGTSIPIPDEPIGSARANETEVSQLISGLTAGSTYHYRVVATNAAGTGYGPDHVFETYPSSSPGQTDICPNAAARLGGLSEDLPDCRAYEMVSPPDKNGGNVFANGSTNEASVSGNAVAYGSQVGFASTKGSGAYGMVQYVASRGPDAWSTYAVMPTPAHGLIQVSYGDTIDWWFSPELDHSVVEAFDLPSMDDDLSNSQNLYVEDTKSGHLETVTKPQQGFQPSNLDPLTVRNPLRGASSDMSVVAFQTEANLLEQAAGSSTKLYALDHGRTRLVGILPDGSIPSGGSAAARGPGEGGGDGSFSDAKTHHDVVSVDGARIQFVSPVDGSASPQLYMRENEERTLWVSQSEPSALTPEPQSVRFQGATPDASRVVFSTSSRLLEVDPGGSGYAVYRYTASPNPDAESNLTFLGRFNTQPQVVGMSDDAQRIYIEEPTFLAGTYEGGTLYIWDAGVTRVVFEHLSTGNVRPDGRHVEVSSDGGHAAFFSPLLLPGRKLSELGSSDSHNEMYLYDAASQSIRCVSCPSNGAGVRYGIQLDPLATPQSLGFAWEFSPGFLSRDGRYVFFTTADALVPQDTNGLADAYEYDADTGEVALLSSGTGDFGAWFAAASASGHDAFFVTRDRYSRFDTDTLVDLYDARVNGGLPEPPQPAVPCAGDACQGVPSAVPSFNTASGFTGLGNNASKAVVYHRKKTKPKGAKKRRSHKKGRHARKDAGARSHRRTTGRVGR